MRKVILVVTLLVLASCSSEAIRLDSAQARVEGSFLTQAEASYRKQVVVDPAYRLYIDLDTTSRGYAGVVTVSFGYRGEGGALTLDFKGGEVELMKLNGTAVEFDYNGNFITIPAGLLEPGRQEIRIAFQRAYSQDGSGLYRYVDPLDGRVYLYTDFQPYDANRLFPHFDQPDLKAHFDLTVSAPSAWEVVSTTREDRIVDEGDRRIWRFPRTTAMSSYIFSLHAGEYAVWEDREFRYPLRLFARQSLAQYVEAEEWFELTRQGFDFFEDYFDFPYPFEKYDQLIVPDYNAGAMENIAAITFAESFIHRGEATRRERLDRANVIMHEMAHMWFGDIATMAWWNGLWLNESFATFMAEMALFHGTEFRETWQEFFMGMKDWAYWEDSLVTTHPIELPVANTDEAFTNFDGITYGKGAAVLKQLSALLGDEVFRQGVREYLATNAWGNTELKDFIEALERASDRDLEDWTQRWLHQAGTNTLEIEFSCDAGKVQEMSLLQLAPAQHPTLREQRTQLALFRLDAGRLALDQVVDLVFDGPRTPVVEASGSDCPDFVYPNYQDWAFARINLDEVSLASIRRHIGTLDDPLLRTMVWFDLFSMVEFAQLPLTAYLDILEQNLSAETNLVTRAELFDTLRSGFSWLHQIPRADKLLFGYADRFEPLLWQLIQNSDGDARQQALEIYVDVANNEIAWNRLQQMLSGELVLQGYELDQDQRWKLVRKLAEFNRPGYGELIVAEEQRDTSSIGVENAIRARVLASRGEEKWEWLLQVVSTDEALTLQRRRSIQAGLFPSSSQRSMAAPFAERILAGLPQWNQAHDVTFHDNVTRYLMPRLCTAENVQSLKQTAADHPDLNPAILKGLRISAQMDQRCVDIGALLRQP